MALRRCCDISFPQFGQRQRRTSECHVIVTWATLPASTPAMRLQDLPHVLNGHPRFRSTVTVILRFYLTYAANFAATWAIHWSGLGELNPRRRLGR